MKKKTGQKRCRNGKIFIPIKIAKGVRLQPLKCQLCGMRSPGEEIECPDCGQLKRDCCGIAGRNVRCFECEEKE